MAKPFDLSKFRKELTKSIEGLGLGFSDPTDWVSTGSYALNQLISGDFHRGIPLGKVTVFAGESGCLPEHARVVIRHGNQQNQLFTEQHVSVAELGQLLKSAKGVVEIHTPDGFQPVGQWFDKGVLPLVRVSTSSHSTECAENHLIQLASGHWMPAAELSPGTAVLTRSGTQLVQLVQPMAAQQCYDFEVLHPQHRYWGDGFSSHNSGKSYICSGNIVRNAQQQGIYVVLIDTENALDETWLQRLGVSTSADQLLKLNMAMIDDVAKTISLFMKDYRALPVADRPRVLFVIDSLGMLLTSTDVDQFDRGEMKGDLGRKAKALTSLVRNSVNMLGSHNVGMVVTNHVYASQDMFDPDDRISGGQGVIYASSIVVAMKKLKLKEDVDGNRTSTVQGIRAACKIMKTRYSKPFESIEIKIPWETGMDPYSGVFDYMEQQGLLSKEGNRFVYTDLQGQQHRMFRREYHTNHNGILDLMMQEFSQQLAQRATAVTDEQFSEQDITHDAN